MIKHYRYFVLTLLLLGLCPLAVAQTAVLNPTLSLLRIKPIKVQESSGDEVYFDITVYPSYDSNGYHYKIPTHPLFWPSGALSKMNPVKLWAHPLKDGQAATLIVSLVEHDLPPWNTDDLIGTLQIHIKNHNGQLISSWSKPNVKKQKYSLTKSNKVAHSLMMRGENGSYQMTLQLKN